MSAELRPHRDPVWTGDQGVIEDERVFLPYPAMSSVLPGTGFWFYPVAAASKPEGPYPSLEAAKRHVKKVAHA